MSSRRRRSQRARGEESPSQAPSEQRGDPGENAYVRYEALSSVEQRQLMSLVLAELAKKSGVEVGREQTVVFTCQRGDLVAAERYLSDAYATPTFHRVKDLVTVTISLRHQTSDERR